jgi:hypothetical protein
MLGEPRRIGGVLFVIICGQTQSTKDFLMTRADLTDITFVLDRSGSMQSIKSATIESFNRFVHSQRTGDGTAQMSLVQFDDHYEQNYQAISIETTPDLNEVTYVPRASTALLDAIGRTIQLTGERLKEMPENERPGTVVFVILTDGYENASREYTLPRVNDMIREQRDKYSWQFIFLGANQDAIATAARMGMGAGQSMTFAASPAGTHGVLNAFDKKMHLMRTSKSIGLADAIVEFDEADRNAAAGESLI